MGRCSERRYDGGCGRYRSSTKRVRYGLKVVDRAYESIGRLLVADVFREVVIGHQGLGFQPYPARLAFERRCAANLPAGPEEPAASAPGACDTTWVASGHLSYSWRRNNAQPERHGREKPFHFAPSTWIKHPLSDEIETAELPKLAM